MEMRAQGGWSLVSQFGRLAQCLPWEGEGQVPNGEERTLSGGPQTILLCQHWLSTGSCPEVLFDSDTKGSRVKSIGGAFLAISKKSHSFAGFVLS